MSETPGGDEARQVIQASPEDRITLSQQDRAERARAERFAGRK